jgi:pyruvate dehydrogenase complex dehydrogenase (E1) component
MLERRASRSERIEPAHDDTSETGEWFDALDSVYCHAGSERNTMPPEKQPFRITAIMR